MSNSVMDASEREWITAGLAWVALRHWLCGRAEGEAARIWLWEQWDRRRAGRHVTPDMERLEADLRRVIACPPETVPTPAAKELCRMPEFGSVA